MDDFRQRMIEAGFSQRQMKFFEEWKAETDGRLDEVEEILNETDLGGDEDDE